MIGNNRNYKLLHSAAAGQRRKNCKPSWGQWNKMDWPSFFYEIMGLGFTQRFTSDKNNTKQNAWLEYWVGIYECFWWHARWRKLHVFMSVGRSYCTISKWSHMHSCICHNKIKVYTTFMKCLAYFWAFAWQRTSALRLFGVILLIFDCCYNTVLTQRLNWKIMSLNKWHSVWLACTCYN